MSILPASLRAAQIHRFREYVALYVASVEIPRGVTAYLTPTDARTVARALLDCADSCEREGFANSNFKTVQVQPSNAEG